jgi:hypothetical protein
LELQCKAIGTRSAGWYYPNGTLYNWESCGLLHYENIGTKSEGWYYGNTFYKFTASSTPYTSNSTVNTDGNDLSQLKCKKIGTRSEGWYYPDGTFYKFANCSETEEIKNMKLELEKLKSEKQNDIEANKEKIKENRDSLKTAREEIKSGSGLTDEQKQKIKVLNEAMKTELAPLVKALRQEKDLEKRKALIEEINVISKKYAEKIKAIAGTNEVVGDFIDKKMAVLDANKELRQENLDTREQARVQKSALVEKYKTAFMGKLKSRLDNISSDKLEKVLEKVNTMIKTTTNNTKLSSTSKENLLSQLEALKEIIENKIDEATIVNDEINLDSLFQ